MLQNQQKCVQYLKHLLPLMQQQRLIQQQKTVLCNKSTNIFRQGKIMRKLIGHKLTGSKKRWIPLTTDSNSASSPDVMFKQPQFGKMPSGGGKTSIRRMTVLNKLFMQHITDLMATGEISENILGKGLQISRVKISQDFAYVSVFWLSNCEGDTDVMLEQELQRCSGLLRHELSQLGLMGVVPRIKFVRDKLYSNMCQVENLLRNMDFGPDNEDPEVENDMHISEIFKQDFYGTKTNDMKQQHFYKENYPSSNENLKTQEFVIPEMRHDVLGLDYKCIMLKILTKMKKSKLAWDQHVQNTTTQLEKASSVDDNSSTIPSATFSALDEINKNLEKISANSEKFEAFLAKRQEKRNTPERKKFRIHDHHVDDVNTVDEEDTTTYMSKQQLQMLQAEDFLHDEKQK